ncbi:MAG: DoxX family membrane protein [Rhodobacteraceae bacterium]|nr:DoxX family membrane protein [Paracoccaceae bacterium]
MKKSIKYFIIAIRIALGLLFVYAGVQKFNKAPAEKPASEEKSVVEKQLPENVVKIKALIGGMKQTGYFWPMLGIAEIVCGVLLLSQVLALLGAVMLVPLTINIFLFELFLGGGNITEIFIHGLYLLGNLLIIAHGYPRLKMAFLTIESSNNKLALA